MRLLRAALLPVGRNDQPLVVEREGDDDVVDGDCDGFDDEAPSGDFAEALSPSGCQYRITAVGAPLRLLLEVPVFAEALTEGSGAATYALPDDAVRLVVEVGCDLDAGWCGEAGTASNFGTYEPTAGTVTVSNAPDDSGGTGDVRATVTFEGVTFRTPTAYPSTDTLAWSHVRPHGVDE